ncbi:MAG: alpha/beta hydrolase [Ruminococcus sp.]|nr:alpha/beta hydrolase [Ruminococcus sp.]
MIEKFTDTESGKIYYWISEKWQENRQSLFFLHGMTGDHTMFISQYEYFKDKYNILLWDAPAHGKSRPFKEFDYEKAAISIKTIFDTEDIDNAVFIGQSMGGFITQAVIKRYPKIVSAFVSIDSTPYGNKYYSKSDIFWLKQIEWMAHLYPLKSMKRAIAKQNTATKAGYDNMLSMLIPYKKNELCHLMGIGYAAFIKDNCDLNITCPVLLIVGAKDNTGKVKAYNQLWSEKTGFTLILVEGAAHNSNVDQPNMVNEYIEKFISLE